MINPKPELIIEGETYFFKCIFKVKRNAYAYCKNLPTMDTKIKQAKPVQYKAGRDTSYFIYVQYN